MALPADYAFERDLVADCLLAALAANCLLEVIGQRKARGSGTTVGAPDALLYCAGHMVPIEFKRAADGRLSKGQVWQMELRRRQGIETRIVRSLVEFVDVVNECRRAAA